MRIYRYSARVVYTPCHTGGSVGVVLDCGEAFVGDLAMNKLPLRRSPGLLILPDDIWKVEKSWRNLARIRVPKFVF